MQSRVGLDFDWFNSAPSGGATINVVTWDVVAQVGVTENLFLDADIPWAYTGVQHSSNNFSKAVFGLPVLGAHVAARVSPTAAFFVGASFGIPAQGNLSGSGFSSAVSAASIRGYQELYRFLPNQFPLRFRGGVEIQLKPFYLQLDLAPSFQISLDHNQRTIVSLDQSNVFGVRSSFGLHGGLRFQESFFLTRAIDHAQTALEPFLGYESPGKSGLFARYGLLMPLDGVEGFAFDRGQLLTQRFSVGARF